MKYAFRCKNCGHLERAQQAGECLHPYACAVCNHGVSFHPVTGLRTVNPKNWDILNDLTDAQLKSFNINRNQVEKHTPLPQSVRIPKNLMVTATDNVGSQDVN